MGGGVKVPALVTQFFVTYEDLSSIPQYLRKKKKKLEAAACAYNLCAGKVGPDRSLGLTSWLI